MDSPFSFILQALWINRSRMASARVASPMAVCHLVMGSWLVTMVEALPCRSSIISSKSLRRLKVSFSNPQLSKISKLDSPDGRPEWAGLKSVVAIKSQRLAGGKSTVEYRYYITSLDADTEKIQQTIRVHWAIENSLHWILDVVFHEDNSRVRSLHAPENIAIIKRMALNQLQLAKPSVRKDLNIKGLRKRAGWDDSTLNMILCA